jgi:HTH-type transcriptional regulator/antitoxin HipB
MSEQIARTEKQPGAIMRRTRKKAGLTRGSLGERIHLRQGTISRLEAGEPAVQLHTVMEVALRTQARTGRAPAQPRECRGH